MTDLTEKLKKGELSEGHYYIKTHGETNIDEYVQWYKDNEIPSEKSFVNFNVEQVLAPVPSYEEWKVKLEENTRLKELLKQARESVYVERANDNSLGDTIWNYTTKLINEINKALGEDK